MKKRLLSSLLTLCMVMSLLPTAAFAANTVCGAFTVSGDNAASYAGNVLTVAGDCTISMAAGAAATTDRIVVKSGTTANITLSGVNIDVSATADLSAFDIADTAVVNLTLEGTNTLKSGNNKAGLQAPRGATLTIGGTGTLNATGGNDGAGIGTGSNRAGGTVTINGGTVTATGGTNGAGIGGGLYRAGGTTTINGGTISATGGSYGAGIGGGYQGAGGNITISADSTVIATGGSNGAGIGGGREGASGTTTISGGTVTATSMQGGAGIGKGLSGGTGGTTTITGGSVKATNGSIDPAPTDGTTAVYLAKLPAVTGFTSGTAINVKVGIAAFVDFKIPAKHDSDANFYLYLPVGVAEATVGAKTYTCTVAANNANVFAEKTASVVVMTETELNQAIAAATAGTPTTIQLGGNIALNATVTITDKNIILDLNGKALSSGKDAIKLNGTASLEVKDSSVGGVLSTTGIGTVTIDATGSGTVTISSGTVSAGVGYSIDNSSGGTVKVCGGTVMTDTGGVSISNSGSGTVNVSGGTVSPDKTAIYSCGGEVTISGGTLGKVSASKLHLFGNPTLTVYLNKPLTGNLRSCDKVNITGELTGADGNITLYGALLSNTDVGTPVATATDASYADATKFKLTNVAGKKLVKNNKNIELASDVKAPNWADEITSTTNTWDNGGTIGTVEELAQFAYNVNHGKDYAGKTITLSSNISLSGKKWTPIGNETSAFKGTFDGADKEITGITIGSLDAGASGFSYIGLFGIVCGAIKNLRVEMAIYSSDTVQWVGGLAGSTFGSGLVINCSATGNVSGGGYVGGLIGANSGSKITNCYTTATVTGKDSVGGLVGANFRAITNCYATGAASGENFVGGLAGANVGPITNCYATGAASAGNYVGGLVGRNIWNNSVSKGTITNCYATGATSGGTNVGGLVGWISGTDKIIKGYWNSDAAQTVAGAEQTNKIGVGKCASGTTNDLTSMASGDMKAPGFVEMLNENVDALANPALCKWKAVTGAYPTFVTMAAQTYTIAYDANGGTGSMTNQTTMVGTTTSAAPNGFTKGGYTFTDWNTAANGGGTAYAVGSQVPSQTAKTTITLYAQWRESTYSVSGTVHASTNAPAEGANVKLMKGNTQIGAQGVKTSTDGTFTITGVPNGTYNLVVEKGGVVLTTKVFVNGSNCTLTDAIKLPAGKTNSVVQVEASAPDIVVGNLDEQFLKTVTDNNKGVTETDKNVVTSGGSVEIKLTAKKKDSAAPNAGDITATASSNGKTVGIFVDLSVLKTVKNSGGAELPEQSAALTELPSLLEVLIPLDASLQGKSSYIVYRYHGTSVDTISTVANADGEKIELIDNGTTIQLSTKKFSTYAIAYQTTTPPVTPPTGGGSGGGSGSSVASSTLTAEQSKDGNITISTDKKTATITPNSGYVIADVMVDGKSIGATKTYTVTDRNPHKIAAVFVKETALPCYIQNGGTVYIGFSAVADKLYKYHAPSGVNVEFKENPKNFADNTIAWAKPSIDFVTERELFLGTTQDTFGSNESMTRAMFVTVIGRLYERSYGSVSGTSTFSDVDTNAYYAKYVAWATEKGIIKGIGGNKFAPNEKVTREQMAVMMRNFATLLKKADVKVDSFAYPDSTTISSWAIDGAKYCQATKVITGRNGSSFAPQQSATRAEVAVVMERFINTIVK